MISRVLVLSLFLLSITINPVFAQSTNPATSTSASIDRARLVGSWTLVREGHFDHMGKYTPVGEHMTGQLIYAQDGSMSVLIMIVPKPTVLSDVFAYSGTFTVDENKVMHHIKISTEPERVNTTAIRLASFRGDEIVLATAPNANGRFEAVWHR